MNTKKIIGVVAVLALVAVALVGAGAAANTLYVDESTPSATAPVYKTFEAAYTAAVDGDVILLQRNATITNGTTGNVFEITKNITIGKDCTTTPILTTAAGVYVSIGKYTATTPNEVIVTIQDIKLGNGYDNANLIQVVAKNTKLTLKNVTVDQAINGLVVINHSYGGRGGGNGSTVTLDNVKVTKGCTSVSDADSGIITLWEKATVVLKNDCEITSDKVPVVRAAVGVTGEHTLLGYGSNVDLGDSNLTTDKVYERKVYGTGVSADTNTIVVNTADQLTLALGDMESGNVKLGSDITLEGTVTIAEDVTLIIPTGTTLTNNGVIVVDDFKSQIVNQGTVKGSGDIVGTAGNPIVTIASIPGVNHIVVYEKAGTSIEMVEPVSNIDSETGAKYDTYQLNDVYTITPVYGADILGFTNINGLYVNGSGHVYLAVAYNDLGTFSNFTFYNPETKEWEAALNGYVYEVKEAGLHLYVDTYSVVPVTETAKSFFNYQQICNDQLTAGSYMTADKKSSFTMPSGKTAADPYTIPGDLEAGVYYLNGDEDNTPIYISAAKSIDTDVSTGTKAVKGTTEKDIDDYTFWAKPTIAALDNNGNSLAYEIVVQKDGEGAFLTQLPSMDGSKKLSYYDGTTDAKKYQFTSEDVGTWVIYAEIKVTDKTTDPYTLGMKDSTPEEYKYVELGTLKIVSAKDHGTTTATLSTDTVKNNGTFYIAVEAPKNDKITVGYRSDDDEDSFNLISTTGKGTTAAFYLTPGQQNMTEGSTSEFTVPATTNLTISLVAQTGLITDKKYTLVVKNNDYVDEDNKTIEIELDITVKGNVFTAQLEKASYDLGENVKILGTYDDSMKLYFYIEGSNVAFMNIPYNNTGNYATFKEKSNGTDWTLTIDGDLFTSGTDYGIWNPGTYTVYVSTIGISIGDATHTYTTEEKSKISAGGKVLTLTLAQPVIEITYKQDEVEKNKFAKVTVEAQGTDSIAAYVVGQNQVGYLKVIDVNEQSTKANERIFSMKSGDLNYLYSCFPVDAYGLDNTISNVLKTYGPADYNTATIAKSGSGYRGEVLIESHLVVKNTDGTYTIYFYIPKSGWDYGQYYIVAQHPMADAIFNTYAVKLGTVENPNANGYSSGANIYTNPSINEDTGKVVYGTKGTFQFNIPSVANLTAAQKLIEVIANNNDKSAQGDFWVVAEADEINAITGVQASYKQGEIITIHVLNVDDIVGGTLEANTFDFEAENLNYIQSFAVETTKTGDNTNLVLTLDTTEVPAGDYAIVLKNAAGEPVKTYTTKIVAQTTPVIEVSVSIAGASSLTVGDTTVLTAKNSDGSTAKFAWKSSDASVASVDENGNVVAKKAGTVTITVENTVTGKTATKTIVVADQSTPVTPTPTKTPGFGILAALAGLGAVAALVLRRK